MAPVVIRKLCHLGPIAIRPTHNTLKGRATLKHGTDGPTAAGSIDDPDEKLRSPIITLCSLPLSFYVLLLDRQNRYTFGIEQFADG